MSIRRSRCVERLKVRDSYGDGIGGIGRRCLAHAEQNSHHEGDLAFICCASPDHGLLYSARRVFVHGQTTPHRRQDGRTPRSTKGDRRLITLNINDALNCHSLRLMLSDNFSELIVKRKQAARRLQPRAITDHAKSGARKLLLFSCEDSVAGYTQGRVNGDYRFGGC
jgi:hypothetical protein